MEGATGGGGKPEPKGDRGNHPLTQHPRPNHPAAAAVADLIGITAVGVGRRNQTHKQQPHL